METVPLYQVEAAPFNGPQSQSSVLLPDITAAPFEGVWVPAHTIKQGSIDVYGSQATMNIQLLGSNSINSPLNTYTATIGGTITATDVVALSFNCAQILSGAVPISHTVVGGDTTTTIATALTASINANAGLSAIGVSATSLNSVITITWPSTSSISAPSAAPLSPTNPQSQNTIALTGSVTGAATETVTISLGTDGSALQLTSDATAVMGLNFIQHLPVRWVKARLTALTGTNAIISAVLHGTL